MSRHPDDFYPTPQVAVDELMRELRPLVSSCDWVFDPAAGACALLNAASRAGYLLTAGWEINADTYNTAEGHGLHYVKIRDYLTTPRTGEHTGLYLANPPYSLAQEFVTKMLNERGKDTIVAVLLRLGFLASQKRANWWRSIGPPSAIRVLSKRPSFTGDGKTDNSDYCWMIWNPPGRGLGLAPIGWYSGGCGGD